MKGCVLNFRRRVPVLGESLAPLFARQLRQHFLSDSQPKKPAFGAENRSKVTDSGGQSRVALGGETVTPNTRKYHEHTNLLPGSTFKIFQGCFGIGPESGDIFLCSLLKTMKDIYMWIA